MFPSASCAAMILIAASFSRFDHGEPERVPTNRLWTCVANEDMDKVGIGGSAVRLDHRYRQPTLFPRRAVDRQLWVGGSNQSRLRESRVWPPRPAVLRPRRQPEGGKPIVGPKME